MQNHVGKPPYCLRRLLASRYRSCPSTTSNSTAATTSSRESHIVVLFRAALLWDHGRGGQTGGHTSTRVPSEARQGARCPPPPDKAQRIPGEAELESRMGGRARSTFFLAAAAAAAVPTPRTRPRPPPTAIDNPRGAGTGATAPREAGATQQRLASCREASYVW